MFGAQTEYGKLRRVLMHRPGAELACVNEYTKKSYNFRRAVDIPKFRKEYDDLVKNIRDAGADVVFLTDVLRAEPDALAYISRRPNMTYVRDLAVVTKGGAVLMSMNDRGRKGDEWVVGLAMEKLGIPVLGKIEPPGTLEGGGITFMDEKTALVSLCERANEVAIKQFCDMVLGKYIDEVLMVNVAEGEIHIDGILMFVAPKLAFAYLPHLDLHPSVLFRHGKPPKHVFFSDYMKQRGVELLEITKEERYEEIANFITTAPLQAVGWSWAKKACDGIRNRGGKFWAFDGRELINGNGGPHCMTCPVERD